MSKFTLDPKFKWKKAVLKHYNQKNKTICYVFRGLTAGELDLVRAGQSSPFVIASILNSVVKFPDIDWSGDVLLGVATDLYNLCIEATNVPQTREEYIDSIVEELNADGVKKEIATLAVIPSMSKEMLRSLPYTQYLSLIDVGASLFTRIYQQTPEEAFSVESNTSK